jgi:hypothetical protein
MVIYCSSRNVKYREKGIHQEQNSSRGNALFLWNNYLFVIYRYPLHTLVQKRKMKQSGLFGHRYFRQRVGDEPGGVDALNQLGR